MLVYTKLYLVTFLSVLPPHLTTPQGPDPQAESEMSRLLFQMTFLYFETPTQVWKHQNGDDILDTKIVCPFWRVELLGNYVTDSYSLDLRFIKINFGITALACVALKSRGQLIFLYNYDNKFYT